MDTGESSQGEWSPFAAKPDRWVLPKLAERSGAGRHPIINRHEQGWLQVRRDGATHEVLLLDDELQPLPPGFRDDEFQPVEQLRLPGTGKEERLELLQAEFQ